MLSSRRCRPSSIWQRRRRATWWTIGKIADIFAHSGTGRVLKGKGNMGLFDATLDGLDSLEEGGLLFANFIEFDTEYGHRRDVTGYAAALEAFDRRIPALLARLDG